MKTRFEKLNRDLVPDPSLSRRVMERAGQMQKISFRKLRPAMALLLAAVLLLSAPTALAFPNIYDLLHNMAPTVAARFAPIQESCEANGIRMEVVAASIHQQAAEFYLTFEDLQQDRLKEHIMHMELTVDGIQPGSGSMSWGFDEKSGCYTAGIDVVDHFGRDTRTIVGDKVTIYVEHLDMPLETQDHVVPLDLIHEDATWYFDGRFPILNTQSPIHSVSEAVDIMGMGYVEGRLHVQLLARMLPGYAIPAYGLHLVHESGRKIDWAVAIVYDEGEDGQEHHVEYTFDISPEELQEYTLICTTTTIRRIEGPWRVTFDLDRASTDYTGPMGTPADET